MECRAADAGSADPASGASRTPRTPRRSRRQPNGMRGTLLTAALSALLLVGGAVAVVSAASPNRPPRRRRARRPTQQMAARRRRVPMVPVRARIARTRAAPAARAPTAPTIRPGPRRQPPAPHRTRRRRRRRDLDPGSPFRRAARVPQSATIGVEIVSPERATTVSPSGRASQRASPGPTTRQRIVELPGARGSSMTPVCSAEAHRTETFGRPRREALDGRVPGGAPSACGTTTIPCTT